jgi:glutathione S-transferase
MAARGRPPKAARVKLYTMPISHWCVAAERQLAFKGVEAELVRVPYHDKQELLAATGQDYVPALVWGGKFVPWHEIPGFLEKAVPNPSLFPGKMEAQARVIADWGHQVLEEKVWRAVVTEVPPLLSTEQERWVFEEMQTRARGPWHVLEARKAEFEKDMEKHLEVVDRLVQNRGWVLGLPGLADFGVFGGLSPLLTVGRKPPARMKALNGWIERIRAL